MAIHLNAAAQKRAASADTLEHNAQYKKSRMRAIAADHGPTILKTAGVAALVASTWYLGGGILAACAGAVVAPFCATQATPDTRETLTLLIEALNTLSREVPPATTDPRTPATLQELLLKRADTYTRDDYKYIVEHILTQSKTLFNYSSITGVHRAPFEKLIEALDRYNDIDVLYALDLTIAKLIELRHLQAVRLNKTFEEKKLHPRLEQLAHLLIITKKNALTHTPQDCADLERILRCIRSHADLLNVIINAQQPSETWPLRNSLNTLLRTLPNPTLELLNTALTGINPLLPKDHPSCAEISDILSEQPQTLPRPAITPPASAPERLETLVTTPGDINRQALFRLIKTIDIQYTLPLEETFRTHLRDHYQADIARDYPLQVGEAVDSQRPFHEFLLAHNHLPQDVVLDGLITSLRAVLNIDPATPSTLHELIENILNHA